MAAKLTIKLNKSVKDRAKYYAKNHRTSLSRMIESYLDAMTIKDIKEVEITPLVESLSGVVNLPIDYDDKNDYANFLNKKYK
jgi:succinyl-CoA synthetase beta subunit